MAMAMKSVQARGAARLAGPRRVAAPRTSVRRSAIAEDTYIREYGVPEFTEEVKANFPDNAVANAEEARVSPVLSAHLLSTPPFPRCPPASSPNPLTLPRLAAADSLPPRLRRPPCAFSVPPARAHLTLFPLVTLGPLLRPGLQVPGRPQHAGD